MQKNTISIFKNAKSKNEKITILTAYDYSVAKIIDESGIDAILVGDSLGMIVLGYPNTLQVTMEDMIYHCSAVNRGVKKAFIIGDLPFMSYHTSVYDAMVNAGRLIKEGNVQAVKLEGGSQFCPQINALVSSQIPVMGHLGLTPQSINIFGGFKVQGKTKKSAQIIIDDAKKLEDAGVFSIVLEGIPFELANEITNILSIPTIGIGAGPYCDGQILVFHDLFNLYGSISPKFVKVYSDFGQIAKNSLKQFIEEVKSGAFPSIDEHSFKSINNE